MVTAALRCVFAQESAEQIESRWNDLAALLAERFTKAALLMHEAKEDVLAFRHFPKAHWKKVWNHPAGVGERGDQVQHKGCGDLPQRRCQWLPADCVYSRQVGALLLEQHEHWQLEGRRMFSADSVAAISELDDIPALLALST